MEVVPFEIAKKLKEKGFREKCYKHYYPNSKDWFISSSPECSNYSSYLDAPTISQVLKWLREKCGIFISIYYDCKFKIWLYGVLIMKNGEFKLKDEKTYKTYELACLAGIGYAIDNLI